MASVTGASQPLTCLKLGDAASPHNHLCNKRAVSLLKLRWMPVQDADAGHGDRDCGRREMSAQARSGIRKFSNKGHHWSGRMTQPPGSGTGEHDEFSSAPPV
jgi:hypothetical protein